MQNRHTLNTQIQSSGQFTSGIDDFWLNDVVKDGVDTRRWDQRVSSSAVLSLEVVGSNTLLNDTRLASTLKKVLSGTEEGTFGGASSSASCLKNVNGNVPWKSPAKEEKPVTYRRILGQKASAHWMLMFP